MKPVIFWGGAGQARVLREALSDSDAAIVAVFDNRDIASPFADVPIFHGELGLRSWASGYNGQDPVYACVAIGGVGGSDRLNLMRRLSEQGYRPLTVIHPRAFVATDARLGEGCQVLALAAVCAGVKMGDGVIINTSASVDHDCVIGDGVHIAPGARVTGEVTVGDYAFVGAGAIVLPRIRVGACAVIGAGAVVTKDVAEGATVTGNPAKPHQK